MSDKLIAPTYAEIVRAYKHFVIFNGSPVPLEFLLDPAVTGTSLETWLGTPANLTLFEQLITAPNGMSAVIASSKAMNAVVASSKAMNAVAASNVAMNAVAASNVAMNTVAASSTAMSYVFNSLTAKNAVWSSDTAVSAIASSTVAYNWLVTNKIVTSSATNVAQTPGTSFDTGKSLLLDVVMSTNDTSHGVQFTTKQGMVGNATGQDLIGHRYTATRFKNVMAVTDLRCFDGTGGNTGYAVTLRYVVMD